MSTLDLGEISALKLQTLNLLRDKYKVLYGYLDTLSEMDLIEIYVELTSEGDWTTFEGCKATIDARIKKFKEDSTANGQLGKYLQKAGSWGLSLLGFGLPADNFCDAYINNPEDQQALYKIFQAGEIAMKRIELALESIELDGTDQK